MPSLPVSSLVGTWVLVISSGFLVDGYVEYKTKSGVVAGKLNTHVVAHSHDDLGWLKTIDQYYVGSNRSIQTACVENILDSVVYSLRRDPNRKFVVAEMDTIWQLSKQGSRIGTSSKKKKIMDGLGRRNLVKESGFIFHNTKNGPY